MKALTVEFEKTTAHHTVLSFGSTGKHYAQIKNGAPFDVFLAADAARPALLEEQGIALIGSRITYAKGKLVLWTSKPDVNDLKETLLNSQSQVANVLAIQ